jgi:CheY-like chemotaxis protein
LVEKWGGRASEAADGDAALSMLQHAAQCGERFRIVLIDKVMPGMGAEELARRIAANPKIDNTTLLLMTPLGETGYEALSPSGTFAGSIAKPIVGTRLCDALAAALAPRGPAKAEATVGIPMPPKNNARILIAEDNPTNREVLLAILGLLGYTANAVEDGRAAVRALRSADYDIVLMDCEMPELDGYEATRLIREPATGARNSKVPIVALTASAMPGDRERCIQAGMDDYIPKPVEPERISDLLRKWLANRG